MLDLGCGNGRVATLLARLRCGVRYVGVDSSAEMGAFDCVLMLAVLHHIPGGDVRARTLRQVRDLLAPQGRVVVSTWQFLENEWMR